MRQERQIGGEIKALSNLLRRKMFEVSAMPDGGAFTEMQGQLLGFLGNNRDQEICQKDVEEAFYIRRSTASRLLKKMEADGFIVRRSVSRDARLKRVELTPKAEALNQEIEARIGKVERVLAQGLTQQEIDRFMATVEKLKKNLS